MSGQGSATEGARDRAPQHPQHNRQGSDDPTCAVVITTYNWPGALSLALTALSSQERLPDEVLVADDGSDARTADVIARHAASYPVPLHHVWHEDHGFRAGAIRNRAIMRSTSEYIIQIDGDILLHPDAVRHHLANARRATFVQGSRALLTASLTRKMLDTSRSRVRPFERGVRHRLNAWYLPLLAPLASRTTTDPLSRVRGCHVAYWRDDVLRINGYNEAMVGWGLEDSEFVARLQHASVARRTLKFSAVAWHLWHLERARDAVPRNRAIYEATLASHAKWCELGIMSPTTEVATPPQSPAS